MIIDPELTEKLSNFSTVQFNNDVYRATAKSIIDPIAPSRNGGRWIPRNECPVLYTSCKREGALAEISFHLANHTPLPSKPVSLHRISVSTHKTLRLINTNLKDLGVEEEMYSTINYEKTQQIGSAVNFLGCDGLIIPSARWNCENLVIFDDHHSIESDLQLLDTEVVNWKLWAQENGFLE